MLKNPNKDDLILCLERVSDRYFALAYSIKDLLRSREPITEREESIYRIRANMLMELLVEQHFYLLEILKNYKAIFPREEYDSIVGMLHPSSDSLTKMITRLIAHPLDEQIKMPLSPEESNRLFSEVFSCNDKKRNTLMDAFYSFWVDGRPGQLVIQIENAIRQLKESR